ncbi:hypothetical protein JHK87_008403 [Glycine soja]|nr:hypothetical protein JHK87_008403 [Glycine soja]
MQRGQNTHPNSYLVDANKIFDLKIVWLDTGNLIVADLFQGHPISERKLKELLGHTPSQVFAGALLGFLVACFSCQAYMVGA